MDCLYYNAGKCLSCSLLPVSYPDQLAAKQQQLREWLDGTPAIPSTVQLCEPVCSAGQGFRNKAKMVVQGTPENPVLGIINHQGQAVDLSDCPLYPEPFREAFSHIRMFIQRVSMLPYDIAARQGELKYLLLTYSYHSDRWMLRFVLRSKHHLASIRKHLPWLLAQWPALQVCSINLQPEHKAILEGETEILLTETTMLSERLNNIPLYLQPQSFFQTNTEVAAKLYQTAKNWIEPLGLSTCWDLFCGVGGFALHLASPTMKVTGIEISPSAIACASRSAAELGLAGLDLSENGLAENGLAENGLAENGLAQIDFRALDSEAFAITQSETLNPPSENPELIVVNPPRRGLGKTLCQTIEQLKPGWLLYSSCNPQSLGDDLARLTDYQLEKVQLFDMFPHTRHAEVLALLKRRKG
jgi:23S rRNA (uracil747-C5)-methyltransferase